MYKCDCGKSMVWTNSIRDIDAFFACLKDPSKRYYQGFCNDTYCGHCFRYLQPLQNSFEYEGAYTDRWGCEHCPENQMILVDREQKDAENEGPPKLFDKYKNQEKVLKAHIEADKIKDPELRNWFWSQFWIKYDAWKKRQEGKKNEQRTQIHADLQQLRSETFHRWIRHVRPR